MPTTAFGSTASLTTHTDDFVYGVITLPTGRAMANGSTACLITSLLVYVAGRGATRAISAYIGSDLGTGPINRAAAGSAQSTGYVGISPLLVNGGGATFYIDAQPNGSFYFGSGGLGGSGTLDSYGTSFGPMGGAYGYVQAPTTPQTVTVTPVVGDSTKANVNWTTPSTDGETAITGYRVEWWYSDDVGTKFTVDVSAATYTTQLTGLTAGKTVVARVAAKNLVTSTAGTTGVYSSTQSLTLSSGGKVWNGSSLVAGTVKVWNGSSLVPAASVKVWNGSTLVPAV